MKNLIAVFSALLMLSVTCPAQPQINGFTVLGEFNGHAYYASNSSIHWTEARDACVAAGGHLATIGSAEENAFIWNQIVANVGPGSTWIGFSDSRIEGQWEWITGEPVTYANWAPGNPDNYNDQDYANMWQNFGGGTWDDYYDSGLAWAALEIDNMCFPTLLPFVDNFDSPILDSCWTWIREDTSHWSLTERPGWMRIIPNYVDNNYVNWPIRTVHDSNFVVETKLQHATAFGTSVGLLIYLDDNNWINEVFLDHGYTNGSVVRAHSLQNGSLQAADIPAHWTTVYMRIRKTGDVYSVFAAPDSVSWQQISTWQRDLSSNGAVLVGLFTEAWSTNYPPAYFDYFRVDPIRGTNVCGDISVVWDSTGSPYHVTCDVTVPAGQTLEIRPGVKVLFTGHYKFNVFGNLQAIGTEQDSIVFTRAFPTDESKWAGFRITNAADTIRLNYCLVEYGNATGGWPDGYGGGLLAIGSAITIENCTFQYNTSYGGAGGARLDNTPYARVIRSSFEHNSAGDQGAGGGLQLCGNQPNAMVTRCLFYGNHSDGYGGGVLFDVPDSVHMTECTLTDNTCEVEGPALASHGPTVISNCIMWSNTGPGQQIYLYDNALTVTFSDVQGGHSGTGNIDADPMFVDAANSNFYLTAASPCIDTGDPNSPLDPDSTRADMGAFPYMHSTLIVNPSTLDFGLIDLGTDSVRHVSLFNPTAQAISVVSISHASTAFSADTSGLGGQVSPHASFQMAVAFNPTVAGVYADTLAIVVTQQGDSIIRIPLRGEAQVILPPIDSLVVQKGPMNGIRLDWAPVTHSISGQPVQNVIYVIYGSTNVQGPFVPFGYATTNSYVHPFIVNTQPMYFYQITAEVASRSTLIGGGNPGNGARLSRE
jgi:regulation of enolase protein 1 (concanavalin A-like superfamily)